ncbi:MAG: hypothetical protein ACM3O6_01695 [Acidobacteriota bacterium]
MTAGLVPGLNRPGGNITGACLFLNELSAKKLGMPRDVLQQIKVIADAGTERETDAAFATISRKKAGALMVGADPFFLGQREQIVALSARHAIPPVYELREFASSAGDEA